MSTTKHSTATESSFMHPGWWATCSCGWRGPTRENHEQPLADAAQHLSDAKTEECRDDG